MAIDETWISGHLYYHESLDLVVRSFVRPLVSYLLEEKQIDAFFFIRYSLGGPHLRLRLRAVSGASERVLETMERAAQRFLSLTPSTRALDEEAIRHGNRFILAGSPAENDEAVYPDNSFRIAPFRPEIERYGGPDLFRVSIDLFVLSSVAALEFLARHGDSPRSVQLAQALELLLRQALAFAASETELLDLIRYGVNTWGEELPKVVAKGARVAETQREDLLRLFERSLADIRSSREASGRSAADLLLAGVGRLSAVIGRTDRATRTRIGASQLHMTAIRFGLSNAEEVYLSSMLTAAVREEGTRRKGGLSCSEERRTGGADGTADDPHATLAGLLLVALAMLAAPRAKDASADRGCFETCE